MSTKLHCEWTIYAPSPHRLTINFRLQRQPINTHTPIANQRPTSHVPVGLHLHSPLEKQIYSRRLSLLRPVIAFDGEDTIRTKKRHIKQRIKRRNYKPRLRTNKRPGSSQNQRRHERNLVRAFLQTHGEQRVGQQILTCSELERTPKLKSNQRATFGINKITTHSGPARARTKEIGSTLTSLKTRQNNFITQICLG